MSSTPTCVISSFSLHFLSSFCILFLQLLSCPQSAPTTPPLSLSLSLSCLPLSNILPGKGGLGSGQVSFQAFFVPNLHPSSGIKISTQDPASLDNTRRVSGFAGWGKYFGFVWVEAGLLLLLLRLSLALLCLFSPSFFFFLL